MTTPEIAGIVALAYLVVREAFSMLRWMQSRRNGRNGNPGMHPVCGRMIDDLKEEIHRTTDAMEDRVDIISKRTHELANDVAVIKGQWELLCRRLE